MKVAAEDPALAGDAAVAPGLLEAILRVVREVPTGQTEHALIARLRAAGVAPFAEARLLEPLSLFQTHFVLFHCLYRLRDRLAAQGEWLRIDCLDIALEPLAAAAEEADGVPEQTDPLRAWYLDLSRLETMDAAAVVALLGRRACPGGGRRAQALEVLGLADPVDEPSIRRRYRQLAQRHHPDRGGDTATLQRINAARRMLLGDT